MGLWVWAVLGLFAGFAVFDGAFGGGVAGLLIGVLVGRIGALAARLQQVEKRLAVLERRSAAPLSTAPAREAGGDGVAGDVVRRAAGDQPARVEAPAVEPSRAPEPMPAEVPAAARELAGAARREPSPDAPERAAPRSAPPLEPSLLEIGLGHAKRWLTTGNVPVKIGVVLSVFGVGFLVKEGIDRQWLVLPIELRLLLVGLFGIALLAVGWRLRRTHTTYALSVQGGGIAVLYLVTYAAFALYALMPAVFAFALLVVVTAAAGALAVLQNARALAVLGIVGGFMAPVLVSSGSGNHVALFGYYAVLNLAILGVAWFKAWRELNLLGFLFTFGIGTLWGSEAYRPELFASTEPFLVLFVVLYTVIPVLFALRQAPELRGWVDGTLVFGTPLVGFGLQSRLVADTDYGLALSALALAAVYVGLATFLYRRRSTELRVLVEAQLALGVAFVTVAVPLALDARWTSAAWALQGAAMVWLGVRQRRKLALAAGIALQLLSGGAYTLQPSGDVGPVLVNGLCLGALLLAVAGAFSARLFDAADDRTVRKRWSGAAAAALLAWGGGWWLWGGFSEIERQVTSVRFELPAELLFIAATVWVAMLGAQRFAWPRLNALGIVAWPLAAFGLLVAVFEVAHPGAALGWLAWPALLATLLVFLRRREQQFPRLCAALHVSLYWLAAVLLAWETGWLAERVADGVWPGAAMLGVTAVAVWLTLRACAGAAWPFAPHARVYVAAAAGGPMAALVAATLGANLSSPGDAAPLPYVPVLNPLELVSVFVLLVLLRWTDALQRVRGGDALAPSYRAALAGGFGGVVLTMAVARAVHHWAAVPFDFDSLAASTVLQASLSIVWGAAALALMVLGARRAQRVVWLVGAALMTVVVAKLFLVDLGNTATLGRVVSFLGVGLLLLVVGYIAPAPPRGDGARAADLGVRDEA